MINQIYTYHMAPGDTTWQWKAVQIDYPLLIARDPATGLCHLSIDPKAFIPAPPPTVPIGLPADHALLTSMLNAPVLPNSDAIIASIGAAVTLHPGFEIPTNIGYWPRKSMTFDSSDSDMVKYPIPDHPAIEGGSDAHLIVVDDTTNELFEIFAFRPGGGGSGACWDMTTYNLRPMWNTSADAAGLPIFPLLLQYQELAAGVIKHALRVTVPNTRNVGNYGPFNADSNGTPPATWPARHRANTVNNDPTRPSMGERLRLKASFDDSKLSGYTQIITRCLKTYGLIVADQGSAMFVQGDTDPGWTSDLVTQIVTECRSIHTSDFEVIDGVTDYIIAGNSGQAKQV